MRLIAGAAPSVHTAVSSGPPSQLSVLPRQEFVNGHGSIRDSARPKRGLCSVIFVF